MSRPQFSLSSLAREHRRYEVEISKHLIQIVENGVHIPFLESHGSILNAPAQIWRSIKSTRLILGCERTPFHKSNCCRCLCLVAHNVIMRQCSGRLADARRIACQQLSRHGFENRELLSKNAKNCRDCGKKSL